MGGAKSKKDWVHTIEPRHVWISREDLLQHRSSVWRRFMHKHEHAGKSLLERSYAVECFIVPGCGGILVLVLQRY